MTRIELFDRWEQRERKGKALVSCALLFPCLLVIRMGLVVSDILLPL
jgi:hypothetical protein